MSAPLVHLGFAAMLGAGLVAGVLFAFSSFVMRALGRLPAREGVAAMQAINLTVLHPVFMLPFFGTGLVCVAVAWLARAQAPGSALPLWAGCALYLVGCIGVTVLCNVPRNERLASLEASSPAAAAYWRRYLAGWTRWNHVRTLAAFAAAWLLAQALLGAPAAMS